jgi:hypothetical protein
MDDLVCYLNLRIEAMENKIAEQQKTIEWQLNKISELIKK